MEKYTCEDYSLFMVDTGRFDALGKSIIKYKLHGKDEGIIFEGEDYYPSPTFESPIGIESASTLLSYLVLQEGDVDDEFFEVYTPIQIKFRDEVAERIGFDWIEKVYPGFHEAGM